MKPTARNLLKLAAAGAVLLLAACNETASSSNRPVRVDAATAAMVNGDPIFFSDVELEAAAQGLIEPGDDFGPEHPDYQTVLDQLVDQRLLAQEAVRRGLHDSNSARRRLEAARERILGNILVESLVASEVTETSIDEMYNEQVKLQQLDDEVRLRHILLETEEDAQSVREQLNAGGDFTTLAFEESQDARTRLEGGAFGWVAPNDMIEPFPSVIADTPEGSVSEPFESAQGWHILKVEERRTRPPKTRDEMRPEIVTFLTFREISTILKELRATARIEARPADEVREQIAAEDALDLEDPLAGAESADAVAGEAQDAGTEDSGAAADAEDAAEETEGDETGEDAVATEAAGN